MKRVLPNSKIVNRDLNESQISKNSNIDIEYNIKRIKKERRYTLILVCCFLIMFGCIFYSLFNNVQIRVNDYKITSGNLSITYQGDSNGIKDTINIRNKNDIVDSYIVIFNNSNKKSRYRVYLKDDNTIINLEKCNNNLIDYSKVKYKINLKEEKDLLSTKKKNKYILLENDINKKAEVEVKLKIYYDNTISRDYHYHGRIVVEEF